MEFTETHEVIDLLKSGLRFFVFCSNPISLFTSTFATANLFMGGLGSSPYVPFIGSKVPSYMMDSNVEFVESFMGTRLRQRVI